MTSVSDISNKDKVAIVVVGYNRLRGLQRLLKSLSDAAYPSDDIPLYISIDASGVQEVYNYVKNFNWTHGDKYVNIQEERLGLKRHIFQCIGLTEYFKAVIILEDDLFVSPYFYYYAQKSAEFYDKDEKVASISLYSYFIQGSNEFPFHSMSFQPLHNGYDAYAMQVAATWGEMFTHRMGQEFLKWADSWNEDYSKLDIPHRIKKWKKAWSKYLFAYMLTTGKFTIIPYESLSVNFNDAEGTNGKGNIHGGQSSLLMGHKDYRFGSVMDIPRYSAYYNNLDLYQWLGVDSDDIDIDVYGARKLYSRRYVLTPHVLKAKKIRSFALAMVPPELNVKYQIKGTDIFLYELESPMQSEQIRINTLMPYILRGLSPNMLVEYVVKNFKKKILKLFLKHPFKFI